MSLTSRSSTHLKLTMANPSIISSSYAPELFFFLGLDRLRSLWPRDGDISTPSWSASESLGPGGNFWALSRLLRWWCERDLVSVSITKFNAKTERNSLIYKLIGDFFTGTFKIITKYSKILNQSLIKSCHKKINTGRFPKIQFKWRTIQWDRITHQFAREFMIPHALADKN